jgi:hypothetical protein
LAGINFSRNKICSVERISSGGSELPACSLGGDKIAALGPCAKK